VKFYPSTDPRSPKYPGDLRACEEREKLRSKIARVREAAHREMNPAMSRKLYAAADALAQRSFPIKPKPVDKQLSLFTISGADPETSSWDPKA
jgi:hypothetical protein